MFDGMTGYLASQSSYQKIERMRSWQQNSDYKYNYVRPHVETDGDCKGYRNTDHTETVRSYQPVVEPDHGSSPVVDTSHVPVVGPNDNVLPVLEPTYERPSVLGGSKGGYGFVEFVYDDKYSRPSSTTRMVNTIASKSNTTVPDGSTLLGTVLESESDSTDNSTVPMAKVIQVEPATIFMSQHENGALSKRISTDSSTLPVNCTAMLSTAGADVDTLDTTISTLTSDVIGGGSSTVDVMTSTTDTTAAIPRQVTSDVLDDCCISAVLGSTEPISTISTTTGTTDAMYPLMYHTHTHEYSPGASINPINATDNPGIVMDPLAGPATTTTSTTTSTSDGAAPSTDTSKVSALPTATALFDFVSEVEGDLVFQVPYCHLL